MRDYSVQVTYTSGRAHMTVGYVVSASTEADAKQRGRAAHERRQEPSTRIVRVTAERL